MWLNDEFSFPDKDLNGLLQAIAKLDPPTKVVLRITHSKIVELVDKNMANRWVHEYIEPYKWFISYVCVGHVGELDPEELSQLWTVMSNIIDALEKISATSIKVSTCVDVSILEDNSKAAYSPIEPPSHFRFKEAYVDQLKKKIFNQLNNTSTPIFATIFSYEYIQYPRFKSIIDLPNYLLEPCACPYLHDGELHYKYVYDAMIDSIYCAMNRWGFSEIPISVLSGWPTAGPDTEYPGAFTVANAKIHNRNLATHVKTLRAEVKCNFICSLLDEDLSTGDEETKHLGTFILWYNQNFPTLPC